MKTKKRNRCHFALNLFLNLFLFFQPLLSSLPHQPLANDSSSPQRGYSPPRVAEGGGTNPSPSVDPFAGSDAFGAAGEFRPPSATTTTGPAPFSAADAGATFGGGGGGSGRASPARGTSPSRSAAAVPSVPAVLPFNDTPVPPVSTAAGGKKSSGSSAAAASSSGNNNGGRSALLGGAPAPSSGALGGTTNGNGDDADNNVKASVFSLRRHRSHFNVDTADVLNRMKDSVVCIFKPDFLERVGDSPDLYGPFWIATTLVFLSAVAGNIAAWASWKRKHGGGGGGGGGGTPPSPSPSPTPAPAPSPSSSLLSSALLEALLAKASSDPSPAWLYDVNKVGYSAVLFYGYVAVVGGALFAALRFVFRAPRSSSSNSSSSSDPSALSSPAITLPAVWCAYGYSLTPFIPVSMLAVIPNEPARWSLIMLAAALSGAFLLLNFRGSVYGCAGPRALPTTVAMGCAHAGLAVALKLYIFHYWK